MVFLVYARQHIAVAIQLALWCFAPFADGYVHCIRQHQMQALVLASFVVGVARFELAASWSRTKRATKLRYTPENDYDYTWFIDFLKVFWLDR